MSDTTGQGATGDRQRWDGDPVGDALATLRDLRSSTAELQARLTDTVLTTTARNRMFTVTTDAAGTLQQITFTGDAYRSLPPAELASLLVDTIGAALDAARQEMEASVADVLGVPASSPAASAGTGTGVVGDVPEDLDALLERFLDIAGAAVTPDEADALRRGVRE